MRGDLSQRCLAKCNSPLACAAAFCPAVNGNVWLSPERFIGDPNFLILDEATSALDRKTAQEISRAAQGLDGASHDPGNHPSSSVGGCGGRGLRNPRRKSNDGACG